MKTNTSYFTKNKGRKIQLNARQQFLYKKYAEKYGYEE